MTWFIYILLTLGLISGLILYHPLPFKKKWSLKPQGNNPQPTPTVSIIIPARNEEFRLPKLLTSLKKQTLKPFEIIVVNDDSQDNTEDIAHNLGARVLNVEQKPDGWLGKTWACNIGARAARGEIFIFLDADVELEPVALHALVQLGQIKNKVISVQPYHRVHRMHEQLSGLFNMQVIPAVGIGDGAHGLFGPCILIYRELYFQFGGHGSVASSILDDVDLGKHLRSKNINLENYLGGKLITFRMYPEGFRSLANGWTKNFLSGAGATPSGVLLPISLWIIGGVVTSVQSFFILVGSEYGILHPPLAVLFYLFYSLVFGAGLRFYGNFSVLNSILLPVHLIFYTYIMVRSWWIRMTGGSIPWRGRSIHASRDKGNKKSDQPIAKVQSL